MRTEHQRLLAMLAHAWLGEVVTLKERMWSPDEGRGFVELDASALCAAIGDAPLHPHDAMLFARAYDEATAETADAC